MLTDPSSLRIVLYPDPVLKQRAADAEVTPDTRAIALRMVELMHGADGIGLAAPQVGLPLRIFVADVPGEGPGEDQEKDPEQGLPTATDRPEIYINPVIETHDGPVTLHPEGCLSLPGITGDVPRPPIVEMSWTDLEGIRHTRRAAGLLARCWQHELDHLNGTLILDRMTQGSRLKNRPMIRNLERGGRRR